MHNSDLEQVLTNNFDDLKLECILNEYRNQNVTKTCRRYTLHIKQFALTLYFYSPKAYEFLRETLFLPHPSMLKKWLSNYDCNVGFLTEVFEHLQIEVPKKDYLKDVALIFDSMAIRTQILHDIKTDKNVGYVDYGGILNNNSKDLATEVLVFQIVSYNKYKCPIAYFFINKINANVQAQLVQMAIEKLYDVGITVRSITCDGARTNLATFTTLGCIISDHNMKSYLEHPFNKSNIYCILDPCHLLKLARNDLAELLNMISEHGLISFHFIKKLYELQELADLKLANKLNYNHIYFKNKKMNVSSSTDIN